VAGEIDERGEYQKTASTYFYEFDPSSFKLAQVTSPKNSDKPPFLGRMLLLPTGQVLFANGTTNIGIYTPDGVPDDAWRPTIVKVPSNVQPHNTYTLYGRQINGLSQACSSGTSATTATNYPIVRIRNVRSNRVFYCRTHDHSSMGVQTGTMVHSTHFTVPLGIELGLSELTVIANGIPSLLPEIHINVTNSQFDIS
jgi:hypothetical protein